MRHRHRLLLAAGVGAVAAVPVILRAQEARDRAKLARGPLSIEEILRLCREAGYEPLRRRLVDPFPYDWDAERYQVIRPPESQDLDLIDPGPVPPSARVIRPPSGPTWGSWRDGGPAPTSHDEEE